MKISASFLGIKDNFKYNVTKLCDTNIDYIHLDVMDGKFVSNKTNYDLEFLKGINKPKDVHLMVSDIYDYIDLYASYNPEFITFHYEATKDPYLVIDYIKSYNIKVGISIKPDTDIEVLKPFLNLIDLILVMSVEPGKGGQEFIINSTNKVNDLRKIRDEGKYRYQIEVDGGINNQNYKDIEADIIVVGSFITNSSNYQARINKFK